MPPQLKHQNLISAEPLLQWKLGTIMTKNDISKLYPHVVDLKTAKCPCANDVVLLGFIMNTTLDGKFAALFRFGGGVLYFITVTFNWQYKLNT